MLDVPERWTRREILSVLGLLGAAGLAACSQPAPSPTSPPAAKPAAQPAEKAAPPQQPQGAQKLIVKVGFATLNDTVHHWANGFKERAEKATNGSVEVQIFPSSQLGNNQRMLEAVQLGTLECTAQAPEFMAAVDKRLPVAALPQLFKSTIHAIAVVSKPNVFDAMANLGIEKGVVGAAIVMSGPMGVEAHVPIRTLDDFKGKKIRVLAAPANIDTMQALGATGVPMPLDETATALSQRTVDGVETSAIVAVTLKYHELVKYLTRTGHSYAWGLAVFSKKWLDGSVPKDVQPKLFQAAKEAASATNEFAKGIEDTALKTWKEKSGNEVIDPDDAFKASLREKLIPVQEKFVRDNPDGKDVVELIRKEAAATS